MERPVHLFASILPLVGVGQDELVRSNADNDHFTRSGL